MPDESGEGGSPDEVSRVDGLKDRLKDAGQKVSAASKKAAQKLGELVQQLPNLALQKTLLRERRRLERMSKVHLQRYLRDGG